MPWWEAGRPESGVRIIGGEERIVDGVEQTVGGEVWMYIHVRNRGGVGRTLDPRTVERCAQSWDVLLRVWRDLRGNHRRQWRYSEVGYGFGRTEI